MSGENCCSSGGILFAMFKAMRQALLGRRRLADIAWPLSCWRPKYSASQVGPTPSHHFLSRPFCLCTLRPRLWIIVFQIPPPRQRNLTKLLTSSIAFRAPAPNFTRRPDGPRHSSTPTRMKPQCSRFLILSFCFNNHDGPIFIAQHRSLFMIRKNTNSTSASLVLHLPASSWDSLTCG